jgi:hypothetical protein
MRKTLIVVVVVVTVLIVVAGGIGFLIKNGQDLDGGSRAYVDDSVVAITTHWDKDELWKRASPNLRGVLKADDLRNLFQTAGGALGPLQQYRGATGEATISFFNTQIRIFANYIAKASFEKGDADFKIGLVKIGDAWMIEGFYVNSSALFRNHVTAKG